MRAVRNQRARETASVRNQSYISKLMRGETNPRLETFPTLKYVYLRPSFSCGSRELLVCCVTFLKRVFVEENPTFAFRL